MRHWRVLLIAMPPEGIAARIHAMKLHIEGKFYGEITKFLKVGRGEEGARTFLVGAGEASANPLAPTEIN